MELQLQIQQAQAHRQTLDRLARRVPGPAATGPSQAPAGQQTSSQAATSTGQAVGTSQTAPVPQQTAQQKEKRAEAGFLLANLDSDESEEEDMSRESAKQRIFIQELLLSALNLEDSDPEEQS